MNPWKVSAQFAAFLWHCKQNKDQSTASVEAAKFAKENWIAFLPCAHEGYGRLLIKIAKSRRRGSRSTAAGSRTSAKRGLVLAN